MTDPRYRVELDHTSSTKKPFVQSFGWTFGEHLADLAASLLKLAIAAAIVGGLAYAAHAFLGVLPQ